MTTPSESDPWITFPAPKANATLRLLCFPNAGGGVAQFVSWMSQLPVEVELATVSLPGREGRRLHAPFRRMEPLVKRLAVVAEPLLDCPFVFWGHSLGAIVAFELTRELRRQGRRLPGHLFVAARRPPQTPTQEPAIHNLPDAGLIVELQRRYRGMPSAILQDPEMLRLFIPPLRADLEILDTYQYVDEPPLACSLSAYVGREDELTRDGVSAWREQITGSYTERTFSGGHFFLQTDRIAFLQALAEDLRTVLLTDSE